MLRNISRVLILELLPTYDSQMFGVCFWAVYTKSEANNFQSLVNLP